MSYVRNGEAVYTNETKFDLEAKLLRRVQKAKKKINKYPVAVQNEIEKTMHANIIFHSQAIEEDTIPKESAIPYIKSVLETRNGELFRL